MDKKKGIIIAVVLILLLLIGVIACTRQHDEGKLEGNDPVIDQDNNDQDNDNRTDHNSGSSSDNTLHPDNGGVTTTPGSTASNPTSNSGNVGQGGAPLIYAPSFNLDSIKIGFVEFGSEAPVFDTTISDSYGNLVEALVAYEFKALGDADFVSVDDIDTYVQGEYRITYTVTNEAGSLSESFIMRVADTEGPSVIGIADGGYASGDVTLIITDYHGYEATLNGAKYVSGTKISGDGDYVLITKDQLGNERQVSFTIDSVDPVINVVDGTIQNANLTPVITEDNFDYIIYKKDGRVYSSQITAVGNTYSLLEANEEGVYEIQVFDKAGNDKSVSFIIDKTAPIIQTPDSLTTPIEADKNATFVQPEATATDNFDQTVTVSKLGCDVDLTVPGNGYVCHYSATDTAGNQGTLDVTVTVIDTAPILKVNKDRDITLKVGSSYVDEGATAIDKLDGDITSNITVSYSYFDKDGTRISPDPTSIVLDQEGTFVITYTIVDQASNSVSKERVINVVTSDVPTITITNDRAMTLKVGSTYVDEGATASSTTGDITSRIQVSYLYYDKYGNRITPDPESIVLDREGQFVIKYTVIDDLGIRREEVRCIDVVL